MIDENGYAWGIWVVLERDRGGSIRAVLDVLDEEGRARLAVHDIEVYRASGCEYEYEYREVRPEVAGLARSLAAGRYVDPRHAIARVCETDEEFSIIEPLADFYASHPQACGG